MTAHAVLVDSNILLDVLTEDARWFAWSGEQLAMHAERYTLVINPLIYAEVSLAFERIEDVNDVFAPEQFRRDELPWPAAFLAGRAYLKYRRTGGTRRSPLPDFYIGAHAAIAGFRLLTRDPARYRTYFPRLDIVAP